MFYPIAIKIAMTSLDKENKRIWIKRGTLFIRNEEHRLFTIQLSYHFLMIKVDNMKMKIITEIKKPI